MKRLTVILLVTIVSFFAFAGPDASAQRLKVKKANKTSMEQQNFDKGDILFVTGMIKDAETNQLLQKGSKIKLDGITKDVVVHAQASEAGTYAIALDKSKLRYPAKLVISIKGYDDVVIGNLTPNADYMNADIFLSQTADEVEQNATPVMEANENGFQSWGIGDSPFDTFIFR